MIVRHGSWWQKVGKPLALIAAIALLAGVLVLLILAGYNLTWTGFLNKTLWDWLQLLIIPAVLAVGGYLFSLATSRTEHKIAIDNQRDTALQTYLDRMSELILKDESQTDKARELGRTWTKVVLTRLDPKRKGSVLKFLYESHLIEDSRIIDISRAELDGANLRGFILSKANLSEANLSGADLRGTDLSGAKLRLAELQGAKYNTVAIPTKDARGNSVTIVQTQWPRRFILTGTGTICDNHPPSGRDTTMPDGSKHP